MPLKAGRTDMKLSIANLKLTLGDFNLQCSLDLPSGKLTTLLGPSGCGKTSLLKSIAGLYSPGEGNIILGDRDITELDPRFRKIGMVFQDYALFPHMSVQKNICYGMPLKKEEARIRCTELLEMVELKGFEERRIEDLSGGEKQRIALARALASEPELLLLDEPLSALDARLRKILRRQIKEIQKRTGITTVYVTHDQEEAMAISDQIVLMRGGRVVQTDSPEEIYKTPVNSFAGDFFGNANILTQEQSFRILGKYDLNKVPSSLKEMDKGRLFFRPESCRLLNENESAVKGELTCRGQLSYSEFGGDFHYMEIACADHTVKLKSRDLKSRVPGEEIKWAVALKDCRILN
jgi:thiamine transport system ATP-binding protein